MTPVEYVDGFYFKRDDKFEVCGVHGGKSRAAYQIIHQGLKQGHTTFVTAGSRMSPQCEIVSYICEKLGVKCHLFMPNGAETTVTKNIANNRNSIIHRCKVGYNSVICYHAELYAAENGYYYIPFGMECIDNIQITKHQVRNIPECVKRIVVPCGSAMSMISIIMGLEHYGMTDKVIIGVSVGKDPSKNINKFLGDKSSLFNNVNYTIVKSNLDYHQASHDTTFCGIELDPIYEAKCIPFLQKGDLLWIVGKRL